MANPLQVGGGSFNLQRAPGSPGAVQRLIADGSTPLAGGRLAVGLPGNFNLFFPEEQAQQFYDGGVTGTVASNLAALTIAADGTFTSSDVTGTLARTLSDLTTSASGTVGVTGTSATTLASLTSAASGTVGVTGALSAALSSLTSTASGTVGVTGSLANTLAALTSTASGTVGVTGALSANLSLLTSSASGTVGVTGESAATLAPLSIVASGEHIAPIFGALNTELSSIILAASGSVGVNGASGFLLEGATSNASGSIGQTGDASFALSELSASGSGSVGAQGFLSATLGDATLEASDFGAVTAFVLPPLPVVKLLAKKLEFPLYNVTEQDKGIFQGDVIIRTAIVAAIADIRSNPWLVDHAFATLPKDELTAGDYGERTVARAKEWFLKTDLPVSLVPRIDEGRWPRITISMAESSETENTLSDQAFEAVEYLNTDWPAISKVFTPTAYIPQSGRIQIPSIVYNSLKIAPGMSIVDAVGNPYLITRVDNDEYIYIKENTIVDLRGAVIKPVRPSWGVNMESASFRETYHIGVHVGSEPVYLQWAHTIVVFALMRYRQALLEARGFERSYINSSDFARNEQFESELVFSRYITLQGVVRNYWPKVISPVLNTFEVTPAVNTTNSSTPEVSIWSDYTEE